MKFRLWMFLVALVLAALLSVLAALMLLGHAVAPDPPAPDLQGTRPEPVVTHMGGGEGPPEPAAPAVVEPTFDEEDLCPLDVTLEAEDGGELREVRVDVWISPYQPGGGRSVHGEQVDDGATWLLADLPCGIVDVDVKAAGYVREERENVDTVVERSLIVTLVRGVLLSGIVSDPEGEPIAHARVHADESSNYTDDDGSYILRVDPARLTRVFASAGGYLSHSQRLRLPEDTEEDVQLDITLNPSSEVTVYCAGLPDDSCASIMVMCTSRLLPMGKPCHRDPTTCTCPAGPSAIRGGGASVEVEPDQVEAWLDLRGRGSIRGQVLRAGEPAECDAFTTPVPDGLPDLSGGLMAFHKVETDEEGAFRIDGLEVGKWNLQVACGRDRHNAGQVTVPQGGVKDLGVIDLEGGGLIEGVVFDGLTGQGAPGEGVMAISTAAEEVPDFQMDTTGSEGRFSLRVQGDGDYQVMAVSRPFESITVEVEDGHADRDVVLTTGAADLLAENGFSLVTDERGDLVVDGVSSDVGLEEGDVVDGVLVVGLDLGATFPGWEDMIIDNVLEHYGGPGVTLRVDRDGDLVEVPLD